MKGQPFHRRLAFAISGLRLAFVRERSFRTHVLASAFVLLALFATHPSPVWWAIGALTIGQVLVAELVNTALETLVDHLHPDQHPEIRVAKDVASGAVLVASMIAVLVAVMFILR